jgi:propionate CoA-transferase
MEASQATKLIKDGDCVWVVSCGGGINEPSLILEKLEASFLESGHPSNLLLCHSSGIGDKNGGGSDRFSHPGMVRKVIGSHWSWSPRIQQMALNNEIEAYVLPQGVMVQLAREIAGGKPGLISHVGLGTFIDPRIEGGAINKISKDELSKVIEIDGNEYLFYKSFPIDVTILRGTTADEDGNISFEHEGLILEGISAAQAAKNSGGIVIAQVKRVVKRGMLKATEIRVPGILVDAVVLDPNQRVSFKTDYNPSLSGEYKIPLEGSMERMPLNERKVIAKRAAMELYENAKVNLGFGMPDGVASVVGEENLSDYITLTVEQGIVGGVPASGTDFGIAYNANAIIEEPYQFDWYDGGGLDLAVLSFAEIDKEGNVNVSKFGDRVSGVGGFINISQNAKQVVFVGTFTTAGLKEKVDNNKLEILSEGKVNKLVDKVSQISFSGEYAKMKQQKVLYVTERAVFELTKDGIMLIEVAPGIDIDKDVLAQMEFKPLISKQIKIMDPDIFSDRPLNLRTKIEKKG